MKIEIAENGRVHKLLLPSGLIFSPVMARFAVSTAKRYAPKAMNGISPDTMAALFTELKRIKKKHGTWELVEVESRNGEYVKITL